MVNGTCPDGHVLNWQSQPLVRDMGAGNLMVAAAILFCGLTFTGISNAKQKHPGCKKGEANQKQQLSSR